MDGTGTVLTISETAIACLDAELCVLPAIAKEKRPAVSFWKLFQERLPTEKELDVWFSNNPDAMCIVAGVVSGNLEMLDFDLGGELFEPWCEKIDKKLLDKLVVECTPSGGWHVVYKCTEPVSGNMKLAQRIHFTPGPDPVAIGGKDHTPRKDHDGRWSVLLTLIETRGEGGLFLCAPSPKYILTQGNLAAPPILTPKERESLLEAAWNLNECTPTPERAPRPLSHDGDLRPGDDYSIRGNVRETLEAHGWVMEKGGDNEYWRRPGKVKGWSASLKDSVFYVFSTNAAPFEPNRGYAPFGVYALLEHDSDFIAASGALREQGYGEEIQSHFPGVDISGLLKPKPAVSTDPGPIPIELLRIPGLVSEVMDHCLDIAPYPNPVMAFCGAIALQAFLAGRKVRDPGDNRTNLYILGLAHSAAGKDHPRKINMQVAHAVGLGSAVGDRFASGEGVQDALLMQPTMLFQTDEIDGMLLSLSKAKDARHESIMGTLLTLYSSANSVYPMRHKAGQESTEAIYQPCLVMLGTAIPNHYYQSLSERMLTNGFFARMLIFESEKRAEGQEPQIKEMPERIVTTAQWWADYAPTPGNLISQYPVPAIVPHSEDASKYLIEARRDGDVQYAKAESDGNVVGTTVWGRVSEQIRKLALVYAVSENHESPTIGLQAVKWAARLVMHQTRRMLHMAQAHVAENPFHAECLKLMEKLQDAPKKTMTHSVLLKRMKMDTQTFTKIVQTLSQQGDIEIDTSATKGRPKREYRAL